MIPIPIDVSSDAGCIDPARTFLTVAVPVNPVHLAQFGSGSLPSTAFQQHIYWRATWISFFHGAYEEGSWVSFGSSWRLILGADMLGEIQVQAQQVIASDC